MRSCDMVVTPLHGVHGIATLMRPGGHDGPMLTVFSWGYEGWGNATAELVRAFDVVEAAHGYEPPVFVDIRARRQVRAVGFRDDTFERRLGRDRHRWMRGL